MSSYLLILAIISIEGLYDCQTNYRKYYPIRHRVIRNRYQSLMERHGIVPEVIDAVPLGTVQVRYPSGEVNFGNELTPRSVKDMPAVNWSAEDHQFYTLVMTDPDAPSRIDQSRGQIKHWIVVNIPGSDVSKGETLAEYIGSGPSENTGLHRYVFLVYKQPGRLTHNESHTKANSLEGRINFKVRDFAKKYDLGQPIAGNFYQAQYDDYVPEFKKTFQQ